jgi:hypothetical protein
MWRPTLDQRVLIIAFVRNRNGASNRGGIAFEERMTSRAALPRELGADLFNPPDRAAFIKRTLFAN